MNVIEIVKNSYKKYIGKEILKDGVYLKVKDVVKDPNGENYLAFTFENSDEIIQVRNFNKKLMIIED